MNMNTVLDGIVDICSSKYRRRYLSYSRELILSLATSYYNYENEGEKARAVIGISPEKPFLPTGVIWGPVQIRSAA